MGFQYFFYAFYNFSEQLWVQNIFKIGSKIFPFHFQKQPTQLSELVGYVTCLIVIVEMFFYTVYFHN